RVTRCEAGGAGCCQQPPRGLDRSCHNFHPPARSWSVSLWENLVGAVGLEPTNPSLVRRDRTVAGHRGLSLEEPDGWVVRRMTSPDVARRLPPLAPRLAPWDMISLAND